MSITNTHLLQFTIHKLEFIRLKYVINMQPIWVALKFFLEKQEENYQLTGIDKECIDFKFGNFPQKKKSAIMQNGYSCTDP